LSRTSWTANVICVPQSKSSTTSEVSARLIDVERTRCGSVESASWIRSEIRSSMSSGAAPRYVVRTVSVG
jgi:hypothetical protein